jgi:hypothetical protein
MKSSLEHLIPAILVGDPIDDKISAEAGIKIHNRAKTNGIDSINILDTGHLHDSAGNKCEGVSLSGT